MSFLGFNIAGSALNTFQEAENVTAQNIANVQTPGASRQLVNIGQLPPIDGLPGYPVGLNPGTQGTGVFVSAIKRVHQDSYDALFRGATSSQNFYSTEQGILTGTAIGLRRADQRHQHGLHRLPNRDSDAGEQPAGHRRSATVC